MKREFYRRLSEIVQKCEEAFAGLEEGEAYVAVVPDLAYCSAHGETYEEALAEVQVAMSLYLQMLDERGEPIPEPRARTVS